VAQPNYGAGIAIVSTFYWVTFIMISGLVMLSLFIGAVTMSMAESMNEMKDEQEKTRLAKNRERAARDMEMANAIFKVSRTKGAIGRVARSEDSRYRKILE
jgi:hypothetical protein